MQKTIYMKNISNYLCNFVSADVVVVVVNVLAHYERKLSFD